MRIVDPTLSPTIIPLSVLDLSPIPSGGTPAEAILATVALARSAEKFGYHRYWLAEHHGESGLAGSAPTPLISAVAAATTTIRVGAGAVLLGYQSPFSLVEQFGVLDALYPGRVDLALGRSAAIRDQTEPSLDQRTLTARPEQPEARIKPAASAHAALDSGAASPETNLPPSFPQRLTKSEVITTALLFPSSWGSRTFPEQVEQIIALQQGTYELNSTIVHAIPGERSQVQLWIVGSRAGQSARLAGRLGLPFGASYHSSPTTAIAAINAYREAFASSDNLSRPYVIISAEVVVASTDARARNLALCYRPWLLSIRRGQGAIPFPSSHEASRCVWTSADESSISDRVASLIAGSPKAVAKRLKQLHASTSADEIMVSTITHSYEDRLSSYQMLAEAWA